MATRDNGKGKPIKVNTGTPRVPTAASNPIVQRPTFPKANARITAFNTLHR